MLHRIVAAVLFVAAIAIAFQSSDAAEKDTKAAEVTRTKKLPTKVTVDFKDEFLREAFKEISNQIEEAGNGTLSIRYDAGVSMNQRVSYTGEDQTVAEVLDGMLKKNGLGYVVIAAHEKKDERYDGWLLIKMGTERGYFAGQEPDAKGKTTTTKKTETKKTETKPTTKETKDTPAASADEKAAMNKLNLIKGLIEDGKKEKASERLKELIKQYPDSKAAKEAETLLKKIES